MTDPQAREREHQDAWYARAAGERFFEREGFRRLIAWNLGHLRRAVPLLPTSRVLSIGCGSGEYEVALATSVAHLSAVDLSPVAVAAARDRARQHRVDNVDFHVAAAADLVWPAESFDVVYALGVLHHLGPSDRSTLLRRVHGWITPGGWFYARDPSARGLLRRSVGRWFQDPRVHSPNEAALEPTAVREELRAAGFARVEVSYTDVLSGPLPWLVASSSPALWNAVYAFDRVFLAIPGLRRLASQFDVRAQRATLAPSPPGIPVAL